MERAAYMNMKADSFGINMKQWCREHETKMTSRTPSPELIKEHKEKIRWLQHERLVHLIVVLMVVIVELFTVSLALLHPELGIYPSLIVLGLAVLLGFYFFHYFFLENTVQRWYKLADEMEEKLVILEKDKKEFIDAQNPYLPDV